MSIILGARGPFRFTKVGVGVTISYRQTPLR